MTLTYVLVVVAGVLTVLSAGGKAPLWPAVFVLVVLHLL